MIKSCIHAARFFPIASRSSHRLLVAGLLMVGSALATSGIAMAQNAEASAVSEGETPIRITVGDVVMTGRFNSTTMARLMVERLPVTLTFGNHSGGDAFPTKVTHLEPALPTEGTELGGAPDSGDIAHYVPNGNFGFYYGKLQYWPGVVTLGSFDGDPMVFARQTEPFKVKIELAE
ncbi:cyclophilin-like fold protein [Sinorhizobium meliloti]|uniref:cyclophilin-like fold protein n=1 Tax=Rhizobium meliloti TaxID=382 RepID=UPI0011C3F070|nr:cyclophilin-like fold protein [Sinorhizobium meliloti]